jgi:hypothetical protein
MTNSPLPYLIIDADQYSTPPPDAYERYIDPKKREMAVRDVEGPDGKTRTLYAGRQIGQPARRAEDVEQGRPERAAAGKARHVDGEHATPVVRLRELIDPDLADHEEQHQRGAVDEAKREPDPDRRPRVEGQRAGDGNEGRAEEHRKRAQHPEQARNQGRDAQSRERTDGREQADRRRGRTHALEREREQRKEHRDADAGDGGDGDGGSQTPAALLGRQVGHACQA